MTPSQRRCGFTLVELLTVIAIIALLISMLMPNLDRAIEVARLGACTAGTNDLGRATGQYLANNNDRFFRCLTIQPSEGGAPVLTYFWGTKANPVDRSASPFLKYANANDLLCPSVEWGDYVPQGGIKEPTTDYGYNSWCLDPGSYLCDFNRPPRSSIQIPKASEMFVFADSAMAWAPWGEPILQNSTHLEPPTGPFIQQPTTHFRHLGMTVAVCADGHSKPFKPEGGLTCPEHDLGFVGTTNTPHYDISD